MSRTAEVKRKTGETDVSVTIDLDGNGASEIATGVGFFDHMLTLLASHAKLDLTVKATGDLHVDLHHTVEDVGLALGRALAEALADKAGIRRYGWARLAMDESLAAVAIDLSGRPFYRGDLKFRTERIGEFPTELVAEFLKSLANEGKLALHVDVVAGENEHHVAEAIFKGLAHALRMAVEPDPRGGGKVPSTKGML